MELLHIEQIDTYSYIGDELYNKIMEISEVMTQNENSIHDFWSHRDREKKLIMYIQF